MLLMGMAIMGMPTMIWAADGVTGDSLVYAYNKATLIDPLYQAALAESKANQVASRVAGAAYYPQMKMGTTQIENEGGSTRWSVSAVQPLISADRYATMQEREPRAQIADITLKIKQYDLAKRLYKSFSELILAREGLVLNQSRIESLQQQYHASQRAFDLGQGTITDMGDAEVKVLQAKADDLKFHANLQAADKEYESIVGDVAPQFKLRREVRRHEVKPGSGAHEDNWIEKNLDVILSRHKHHLGKLAVTRAKAAYVPELNAVYTITELNGERENYLGFLISMPIQAGTIMGLDAADANLSMLREEMRDKERRARLDIDRLQKMVESGVSEVATRLSAIRAAEVSVDSNKKSFLGGVRTQLDVLASIETLYSVKNEYLKTLLTLGDNVLNLHLLQGGEVVVGLEDVEKLLLEREENRVASSSLLEADISSGTHQVMRSGGKLRLHE